MLMACFEVFCLENDLSINTNKTKVMLVNCRGTITCSSQPLAEVDTFKYLGITLSRTCLRPDGILRDRLTKARKTFNAVRSNCRLLGLNNARVKLNMANALATSILAYGSVLYACLGDVDPTLQASGTLFEQTEAFVRTMYKWALHLPRDIRGSMLYVMANAPNLQLLCKKACLRFYLSLDGYPRFAT